ncbi:MAG: helix-turn-helix domain-containing protein [Candidatus Hodarchaeota archaeon]
MVGINLTSEELQIIFDTLGLHENESQVYASLLSIGTLTIGQISQLTGLNYIQVRDAIEVLIGGNFIDWTPGKINRYFAREPFLKAFLLAYDPYTLLSIRDTAEKQLKENNKDIREQMQGLIDNLPVGDQNTIQDVLDLIETGIEIQQKQINTEISALTYSIREMKERLEFIYQLSKKICAASFQDSSSLTTDLVFGETTFVLLLRDMVSRAKISLTILMPQPEIQTLITASKSSLPIRTRTLIAGDFSKVPKSILEKVVSAKVKIKQTPVDFWGCLMDNEEILFAPFPDESQQEAVTGIYSMNPTVVRFLGQQIVSYSTKGRVYSFER